MNNARVTVHGGAATKRYATGLLASLGGNVDAVASTLEGAGVRGVSANPRDCAIAVYLGAVVGSDPQVRSVKVGRAEVVITPRRWWGRSVVVPLTPAAREFVAAFDAGRFPGLLRSGCRVVAPELAIELASPSD